MRQEVEDMPSFPLPRPVGCPFDPSDEHRAMARAKGLGKVRIWNGSRVWFVTSYEEHRRLLSDSRLSSDVHRPGFPHFSAASQDRQMADVAFHHMDDPDHARYRRMLMPSFTRRRMEEMRPAIQQMTDAQIDRMVGGPRPADLVEAYALPIPSMVISELLGVPAPDQTMFQQLSRTLLSRSVPPETSLVAQQELIDYLTRLIEKKTLDPANDLLTELATVRVASNELTARQAATSAFLLLTAGHETTANTIGLATLALLENPRQLDAFKAMTDAAAVAAAIDECLRYAPIFHLGRRRVAVDDIPGDGYVIHAGDGVVLSSELANRDPAIFEDPDTFEVSRNPRGHLAFGFGVHQCLGQPLARVELQVTLSSLFRRLPDLHLSVPSDSLQFKVDGMAYGLLAMPVEW